MAACSGQSLTKVIVTSPIGAIQIVGCSVGLHSVSQIDQDVEPDFGTSVKLKSPLKVNDCIPVSKSVEWLENYFGHKVASISVPPLCPSIVKKGSFKEKALSLLPKAVPFGHTISYKQLAELCGNSKACRAAGQSMATNPISLLVPCHRVVSSQGAPGNYSHGKKNNIKVWLINFEKEP